MTAGTATAHPSGMSPLPRGTIIVVHNLRNRLFLPQHGLADVPLMVSAADMTRPYLRRAVLGLGIKAHLGVRGPVFIDSGGFSHMAESHAPVAVDDLIALYGRSGADVVAALD